MYVRARLLSRIDKKQFRRFVTIIRDLFALVHSRARLLSAVCRSPKNTPINESGIGASSSIKYRRKAERKYLLGCCPYFIRTRVLDRRIRRVGELSIRERIIHRTIPRIIRNLHQSIARSLTRSFDARLSGTNSPRVTIIFFAEIRKYYRWMDGDKSKTVSRNAQYRY